MSNTDRQNSPAGGQLNHATQQDLERRREDMAVPEQDKIMTDGDTMLQLDGGSELQVSSGVLADASQKFGILFKTDEQAAPKTNIPRKIELKDVDPLAMRRLCRLLHNRHDLERQYDLLKIANPDEATVSDFASKLLALARVTDHYDCADKITLSTHTLVFIFTTDRTKGVLSFEIVADLVAAAFLLRQAEAFAYFTRRLVLSYCKRSRKFAYPAQVPPAIWQDVDDQRNTAILALAQLPFGLGTIPCGHGTCTATAHYPNLDLLFARRQRPQSLAWPPEMHEEPWNIRKVLLVIGGEEPGPILVRSQCPNHANHAKNVTLKRPLIVNSRQHVADVASGLCMQCIQDDIPESEYVHKTDFRGSHWNKLV